MTAVAIACALIGVVLVVIGRRRRRDAATKRNPVLGVGIFLLAFGLSYLTRWLW